MILDSLAQAYHWSHQDMMKLTMPQIIMYNHASWVNRENYERRRKHTDVPAMDKEAKRVASMEGETLFGYLKEW